MDAFMVALVGLNLFGLGMLVYIHFTDGINTPRKPKNKN
jgi:hypothetical protein